MDYWRSTGNQARSDGGLQLLNSLMTKSVDYKSLGYVLTQC